MGTHFHGRSGQRGSVSRVLSGKNEVEESVQVSIQLVTCTIIYNIPFLLRYVFWFAFELVILSAFTLLKHFQPHTGPSFTDTFKAFRLLLAKQLIGKYNSRQKYYLPSAYDVDVAPQRRRLDDPTEGHFPAKAEKSRRCYYCVDILKGPRHESYCCRVCQVSLCVYSRDERDSYGPSCFELYHLQQ